MHTKQTFTLTAAAFVLSLGAASLGAAVPAQAASTMCTDDHMTAQGDMMAGEAMAGDKEMMTDDAMAKDEGMAMAGESQGTMGDDAMAAHDEMATADESMKEGMMTADYTVKPGDSLWSIAATTLCDGDRYHEIVDANSDMLGGSMMIHPGQVLHIPGD
jgi:nucleoid-associated protein YgaU